MTAIISPCGLYRYRLERTIAMEGPVYAFFGINPSTADASLDDATVRKWTGFCKQWGAARFIVGNVFAYRATDVRALSKLDVATSAQGDNYRQVQAIAHEADILVPCWGDRNKVPKKFRADIDETLRILRRTGKPMMHLGLTKGGDPKHPLMLGYGTPLVAWAIANS
jgi:hypothetical protein